MVLLFLLISFAHLGQAQPIEIDIGSPQIVRPDASTILTEEQIKNSFATTSEDALRAVPGLIVSRSGGVGQPSFIFIRGADSDGTLVLLDGMPINDPSTNGNSFDFSALNMDNIARIEIWKGPQSVLFGSGATGGVINFVTKKGHGPLQAETALEVGSWNTSKADISARGSSSTFAYSASAERYQTNGISASSEPVGGTLERDGSSRDTYSARLGWKPDSSSEVELMLRWSDKMADLDYAPSNAGPYFLEPDALNYRMTSQTSNVGVRGEKQWNAKFDSTVLLARAGIDRWYDNDGDANNSAWLRGHYTGVAYHLDNSNRWEFADGWTLFIWTKR